jgi:DNA-directed RNA polymerases I, II, and III subunit RPABC1
MNHSFAVSRAFRVVAEMLSDRNHPDAEHAQHIRDHELSAIGAGRDQFEVPLSDDGVKVVFYLSGKVKTADLKKLIGEGKQRTVILVTREKLTQVNLKGLADVDKDVQPFELRELQYNVTHHELVPKHEVLTDPAEIDELVRTYQLKSKTQLPLIQKTDAVSRYFGMKPGDLVRITRPSPSAGESIVYRCCV